MSARSIRRSLLPGLLVVAIALSVSFLQSSAMATVLALVGGRELVPDPPDPSAPFNACSVSGFIGSDTTWSPATCDPYIVTGSIIVQTGATLTIQPGTRVKFDSQKALTVQGTLVARGTAASPITFTSNVANPAKGDWGYIHFTDTSIDATFDGDGNYTGGSALQYVIVEYAGGSSVSDNAAVRVDASSPYLDHNTIRKNKTTGINVANSGRPRISANAISDNGISGSVSASGIWVITAAAAGMLIQNNNISDNTDFGIWVYVNSGSGDTLTKIGRASCRERV